MSVKYFVEEKYIPNDGSIDIINNFNKNINFDNTEVYIYPDVHYKKGARVVNGLLIKSSKKIYPACCGVENCGFTFGKIKNCTKEKARQSFIEYAKYLKANQDIKKYSDDEIYSLFEKYLKNDFKVNKDLYEFLNINNEREAFSIAKTCLTHDIIKKCKYSLGTLGGGNHFFELHEVQESYDENINKNDLIFMLHTDSIAVGNMINLKFSNFSEVDYIRNTLKGKLYILKHRFLQIFYFIKTGLIFNSFSEILKLIYSQNNFRTLNFNTRLGKRMLFEHNMANLFGEMNRDMLIENWAKMKDLEIEKWGSHSHDSLKLEKIKDKYFIFHRNGVQNIKQDKLFLLPGALGTFSYIMKNTFNKEAFYSTNHGMGRFQDKHIARAEYTDKDTINELEKNNILFLHIGNGSVAEQNNKAFKDVEEVINQMKNNNLAEKAAKLKPFAVIKG